MKSALIITTLLLLPAALAQTPKERIGDRERELGYRPAERKMAQDETDDKSFKLVLDSKTDSSKSRFEFRFTVDGVPRFALRYLKKSGDTDAAFGMRMGFFRLVEFNGTIRPRESLRVLRLENPPPGATWSSLKNGLKTTTQDDGSTMKSVETTLTFTNHPMFGNLKFGIKAYSVDKSTVATDGSNTVFTPDAFKYSVSIQNWPYRFQGGRLALIHGFWIRENDARTNGTNRLTLGGNLGRFSWDPKITVDGTSQTITSNTTMYQLPAFREGINDDAKEAKESGDAPLFMDFAFPPGGNNMLWDPEIGMNSETVIQTVAATTSGAERMGGANAVLTGLFAALVAFML